MWTMYKLRSSSSVRTSPGKDAPSSLMASVSMSESCRCMHTTESSDWRRSQRHFADVVHFTGAPAAHPRMDISYSSVRDSPQSL